MWSGAAATVGAAPGTTTAMSDDIKSNKLLAVLGWVDPATNAAKMTIFGDALPLYTATLLSRESLVSITNSADDTTLRAKLFTDKVTQLDTFGVAFRMGIDRGIVRSGSSGTVVATFTCSTHTIETPIVTSLNSAATIRCAVLASSNGCCELVCSTGVCFTVTAPTRFEMVG